ncbi:uncharacterized protein LOC142606575 [Castanea sativa]|uniref:uncharacterized protein LOC142606575 n=1 Tax=Castanea sativa TaxID=21020 RepID=UPI003F654306
MGLVGYKLSLQAGSWRIAHGAREANDEREYGYDNECLEAKFRMPQVEAYDGSRDPIDHLESFKTLMHLQVVLDKIMCRAFPTTLKGLAQVWFSKITPNTISTFKELNGLFITHFIGGRGPKKQEKHDDPHLEKGRKEAKTGDKRDERRSRPPPRRMANFTLLNTSLDQVLMQIRDDPALAWPGKLKGKPNRRSRNKYYHFHCDHGHDTSNCYDLKQQIEVFIRQGKLQRFVGQEKAGENSPKDQEPNRWVEEQPRASLREIRVIVGGGTMIKSSKKARKTYLRLCKMSNSPVIHPSFLEWTTQ